MKEACFLAFDLGASSGRAILGKLEAGHWTLKEVHRFPNAPLTTEDGLVWDYPRLQRELKAGLQQALAEAPHLAGIGIDTWGVDYVLFNRETGAIRRLPSHYRDARTLAVEAEVRNRITPEALYRRTGIQHMRINTLYQLVAHRRQHPGEFENSYFLMMADALGRSLGGDARTEYTLCSTGNLLDIRTRQWDWELIDRLDLPRDIFPPIAAPCTAGGVLSEALQRELNCGPIPIWKVGAHDTASAVVAVPFEGTGGGAYISAGTWALLGTELPEPCPSPEAERSGFTNEGGLSGTIRFLTNIMGSWLLQEIRRVWREAGREQSFAEMEALAREAEPCRFLVDPNDAGFVEPGDMPARIRAFCDRTGQEGTLSDAEVVRAVYDSLALYFCGKIGELEAVLGRRYSCLHVVGGGTRDRLLMQLTADALGRPVVAGPVEATAVGNLLGQAMAAGLLENLEQARQTVRSSFPTERYEPRLEENMRYQGAAQRLAALMRR